MSEMNMVWLSGLAGIMVVAGAVCYSWGGRSGKWKRRFVGSFITASAGWVVAAMTGTFHISHLLAWPLLSISYHMGYGVNSGIVWAKVLRRSIYALGVLLAGLIYAYIAASGACWVLWVCQCACGVSSVILGVKNPIPAAAEEFLVCMVLTLFLPFYSICL